MVRERVEGEMLALWRYEPFLAPHLLEAARESTREVLPWLPWCRPDLRLDECESWIALQCEAWEQGAAYEFAIVEPESGALLGGCGVNRVDRENRRANLGYWVRSGRTGHGVASGAARLALDFAFDDLGLIRVEILAAVGNPASQRVAERVGAEREGVLRSRFMLHGEAHDMVAFAVVRPPADTSPRS